MFNWFSKKDKTPVPDLEEINLVPEVIIPEKTTRELYDAAVAEVQYKRVYALILRSLKELATVDSKLAIKQYQTAIALHPDRTLHYESVQKEIAREFPLLALTEVGPGKYKIVIQDPSLESLASVLTTQYLSE